MPRRGGRRGRGRGRQGPAKPKQHDEFQLEAASKDETETDVRHFESPTSVALKV